VEGLSTYGHVRSAMIIIHIYNTNPNANTQVLYKPGEALSQWLARFAGLVLVPGSVSVKASFGSFTWGSKLQVLPKTAVSCRGNWRHSQANAKINNASVEGALEDIHLWGGRLGKYLTR
jgi:hypothetical protein